MLPVPLRVGLRIRLRAARVRGFAAIAGAAGAIAFAVAGTANLLARRWLGAGTTTLLIVLVSALALALLIALVLAKRRAPSEAFVLAQFDRDSGGTGRLLTRFEVEDARYDHALLRVLAEAPLPAPPPWAAALRRVVPWALFALLPFALAPDRFRNEKPPRAALAPTIARVEEKLATLEEEIALADAGESDLARRVEDTKEAAERAIEEGALESALEALDRMERELASAAERAAEAIERAAEAASDAADAPTDAAAELAFSALEDDLAAAGLASALAQAKADLAASQREREAADGNTDADGGDDAAETGAQNGASAALASALLNRLSNKAGALAGAGLLKPMDAELEDRLAELARELREAREAKDDPNGELVELEELDLCDEESHGPG